MFSPYNKLSNPYIPPGQYFEFNILTLDKEVLLNANKINNVIIICLLFLCVHYIKIILIYNFCILTILIQFGM